MKSIKHPGNFLLACVMAVVCLICLSVCLFFRMDGELLAVGFITGVWAVTDFYEAFHNKPIEERVGGQVGTQPVGLHEIRPGLSSACGGHAMRGGAVSLFAAAVRQSLLRKAGISVFENVGNRTSLAELARIVIHNFPGKSHTSYCKREKNSFEGEETQ